MPKEVADSAPNVDPEGTDVAIWTWEYGEEGPRGPALMGIAFQGKSNKPLWYHNFSSESQRQRSIKETIDNRKEHLARKEQERKERREFQHGLEVGAILVSSWGYDQTNVDFYEVTEIKGKMVVVREIALKNVGSSGDRDKVVPIPHKFIGKPLKRKPTGRGTQGAWVKIDNVQTARLWDGKPEYQTSPYAGH